MRFLSAQECSDWLRQHDAVEEPYGDEIAPGTIYLQFEAPKRSKEETLCFIERIATLIGHPCSGLIQMTDWTTFKEHYEDPILISLDEANASRESPWSSAGIELENEATTMCSVCASILAHGMSAYLYLPAQSTTFLFWEGALINLWCNSESVANKIDSYCRATGLRMLHHFAG